MSTTQPPAGRAPGGGAVAGPVQRHLGPALAAITTAGRDLPDNATPGPRRHRRHESTRGQPAPGRDNMSQPARPDPARAPRARDWPAPAPPAHPQHR